MSSSGIVEGIETELSRRQALSMFGGAAITGLVPQTEAKLDQPKRVREQTGVLWSTAEFTTAYSQSFGEGTLDDTVGGLNSNQFPTRFPENSDGELPSRGERTSGGKIVRGHNSRRERIDLFSNIALHKVMYIPWLGEGRWRYTFTINSIGQGLEYDQGLPTTSAEERSNCIAGHSVALSQPKTGGQSEALATILASVGKDAPYAVGTPHRGKSKFDGEWSTEVAGVRIDGDDVGAAWSVLKTVLSYATGGLGKAGKVIGKVSQVNDILSTIDDVQSAIYDDDYREKKKPEFHERSLTPWHYGLDDMDNKDLADIITHRRIFSVDVKSGANADVGYAAIDARSDAFFQEVQEAHSDDKGIRNWEDRSGSGPIRDSHFGQDIAANKIRMYLPTLPDPEDEETTEEDIEDWRNSIGLRPYCYVNEDGDVEEHDCIYTVTSPDVQYNWF